MATTTSPLLEIPTATALQIVSSSRIPLASGTLTLTCPPPSTSTSTSGSNEQPTTNPNNITAINDPILLLTIDKITVPLPSTTAAVSTIDHSQYLLATPLSGSDTGFIHITLPSLPALSPLGIKFTSLLLSHGFLKNSQVENEVDLVSALQIALGGRMEEEGGGVKFSETTKNIASGAVEGSAKIAELSGMVASAVSNATFEAGRWVGEKIGAATGAIGVGSGEARERGEKGPVRKAVDEGMEATANTAGKIGNSAANTSAAIGDSISKTAEDKYGGEAKELVEQSRETVGNVGKVAVDAVLGTSVVWHAGEAAVGAAKAGQVQGKATEEKDGMEDGMEDVKI